VYDGSDATSAERINKNNSTISNYFKINTSTTIQTAGGKKAEQGGYIIIIIINIKHWTLWTASVV